jgi:hypothetical protein
MGDCADLGSGAVEIVEERPKAHNVYVAGGHTKVISDQGRLVYGMLLRANRIPRTVLAPVHYNHQFI